MKRNIVMSLGIFLVCALFFAFPGVARAQELSEGMSQGDFAMWLVKAIGAQSKLPPAAQADDAISFLSGLGVIPEGGWKKGEAISKEWLASLLDEKDVQNLSFDDLVKKVRDHVSALFDQTKLGVFRAGGSSATPSTGIGV